MFFNVCRVLAWIIGHCMYRFEVTGLENVPRKGAFLLCSNHIHAFDPIALSLFMRRNPKFMAKKEIFRKRFGNWFFRNFGAYPLDRSATADLQAFRTTMKILKDGEGIIIFSQGTRMKDFDNVKNGIAVFALKSGAPIIPTGIRANYRLFSKVEIHYGKPISMEEYAGQKVKTELVEKVMKTVVKRVSKLASPPVG